MTKLDSFSTLSKRTFAVDGELITMLNTVTESPLLLENGSRQMLFLSTRIVAWPSTINDEVVGQSMSTRTADADITARLFNMPLVFAMIAPLTSMVMEAVEELEET